jgi:glutamine synthetase
MVFVVEYVWLSGQNTHHDIRSKIKTITSFNDADLHKFVAEPSSLANRLPVWNFDGSSTGQALGRDTEVLMKPVRTWIHPLIKDVPAFVALCECYTPQNQPTPDNTRSLARSVFERNDETLKLAPWFGLEQEYVLYKDGRPVGWPEDGSEPKVKQGPYYCSTGAHVALGRKYAELHFTTCLRMGLKLSGLNAEVMPGQWEYQVGPCEGLESGDHAVLARWVMLRILEADGLDANFDSKPKKGDWNGSGMHTNFSTAPMRAEGGFEAIEAGVKNLGVNPLREIAVYGHDNDQRLSGKHETSRLDQFDFGVGSRCTSVRIPNETQSNKRGYFEDRRPSASADPYLVTSRLFASACNISSESLDKYGSENEPSWLNALRK